MHLLYGPFKIVDPLIFPTWIMHAKYSEFPLFYLLERSFSVDHIQAKCLLDLQLNIGLGLQVINCSERHL